MLPDVSRLHIGVQHGGGSGDTHIQASLVHDLPPELLLAVLQAYRSGQWWELCEVLSKFCARASSALCDDTAVWQQVSRLLPMHRREGQKPADQSWQTWVTSFCASQYEAGTLEQFHRIVDTGDLDELQWFAGRHPGVVAEHGADVLSRAADRSTFAVTAWLLDEVRRRNDLEPPDVEAAVQAAIDGNRLDVVQLLAPFANLARMLSAALLHGRFDIVKLSVERGAAVRPSQVALARTFATVAANNELHGLGVRAKVPTSIEERQQIAAWLAAQLVENT